MWRFPTYLTNDPKFKLMIKKEWDEYSENNAQHQQNPTLFWEANKAFISGRIISYTAAHRKQTLNDYQLASRHLREKKVHANHHRDP